MATTLTATMETYEAARSDATLRVQWEGSEQSVAWLEPNGEEAAGAFPEPLWSEDVHNSLSEWLGPEGKEPIVADDAEAARRRLQASRRACEWLCSEGETADVVGRMPSTPILDAAAEGVIGALAAIDRWRRRGQASLQELVAELRNGSTALTLRWETGGGRIRGAGLVHRTTESNGLETGRRRPMELRRGVIETRIEWRPVEGREEGELHGNAAGEAVRGLLAERDREWERETEEGLRTVATHRDAATRTRARAAGRTAEEEARWIGLEDEE